MKITPNTLKEIVLESDNGLEKHMLDNLTHAALTIIFTKGLYVLTVDESDFWRGRDKEGLITL